MDEANNVPDADGKKSTKSKKRTRKVRKYPTCLFDDALELAQSIQNMRVISRSGELLFLIFLTNPQKVGHQELWSQTARSMD
ncbi:hypothetical protein ACE017_10635 [Shewanella mangrovisoli]|uniref:hypothetical protein n=1 Tax=Shewanella mangrovisoli TaxID=2864211 RepID=UPI0035B9F4FE